MDSYDEEKVPLIRHDLQHVERQMFVVVSHFPVKLPVVEEVLYGSPTSSLWTSEEEECVCLKALEGFYSVDADDLLDVLQTLEREEVAAEMEHKATMSGCWRPFYH